jgi:geranylgeranyl pyrophosphate synthase
MNITTLSTLETVRVEVDAFLARYYHSQLEHAAKLHEDYGALWQALKNLGSTGGKRVRPYVMLTAYQGLGGADSSGVLPLAAALEVLHTSMLIHDDIIDRDYVRYGRPNVTAQYRERYRQEHIAEDQRNHYANAAALLAGDLVLSGAYGLVMAADLPASQRVAAAQILHDSVFAVAGGELLDMEAALLPFEKVDSLVIARLKTAAYSFVYPLSMAGMLANAPLASRQSLEVMGTALGIAYQLTDDILGLFGDEAIIGKTATGDIAEGKRTYLMQAALRRATPVQRVQLEAVLGQGAVTVAQATIVREVVKASGALTETQALVRQYAAEAKAALRKAQVQVDAETELMQLVDLATGRQR